MSVVLLLHLTCAMFLFRWLCHPRLATVHASGQFDGHRSMVIRQLAPLTTDYSELIADVSAFVCPTSALGEKSTTPTICLVCGATMCSQVRRVLQVSYLCCRAGVCFRVSHLCCRAGVCCRSGVYCRSGVCCRSVTCVAGQSLVLHFSHLCCRSVTCAAG